VLRYAVFATLPLASCASEPKGKAGAAEGPEAPLAFASPPPAARTSANVASAPCVVVRGDLGGQPASVEGVLTKASSTNGAASAPFVLQLTRPRCVVGLPHTSFLTEVYVASTGMDLRPLVDMRIRVTGDVIGGANDLGGPAVVILAKDIERPMAPAA